MPKKVKDVTADYLSQLIGFTVAAVCREGGAPPDDPDTAYALEFKKPGAKSKTAWILCDPEGNGPGHLDIRDDDETEAEWREK